MSCLAREYREKHEKLMKRFEQAARMWLKDKGHVEIAEKIPFFRDGVVNPEIWFKEGNDFRPLFILKEVSLGVNEVDKLDDYLKIWGTPKYFEFAQYDFDDIKIGTFSTWQRIAKLAKGLEDIHQGKEECDYDTYDFRYQSGGIKYDGDIEGYKYHYPERTSNSTYIDIMDKIAVLEIKKVGAGQAVNSELSKKTGYYTMHIEPFKDLICEQIELINPTVIICCGREGGGYSNNILKEIKCATSERLWIDGYHPVMSSREKFYYNPLRIYKEYRESNGLI